MFDDYSIAGTVTEDHLDVDVGEVSFRIRILQPLEVSKAASLYGDPSCEALTLHLKKLPDCLVRSWNSLETLAAATDSGGGRERDLQSSQAPSVCPSSRTQDPVSLTQEGFSCPTADEVLSTSSFFLANDGQTTSRISEEIKKLRDLRELWWAPQLAASLQTCAMRFPAFTGRLVEAARVCCQHNWSDVMGLSNVAPNVCLSAGEWSLQARIEVATRYPCLSFTSCSLFSSWALAQRSRVPTGETDYATPYMHMVLECPRVASGSCRRYHTSSYGSVTLSIPQQVLYHPER